MRSFGEAPERFKTRKAYKRLLALAHMSVMSEDQVRFDEIVTPRNLKWSTTSNSVSAEERLSSAKGDLVMNKDIRSSFVF